MTHPYHILKNNNNKITTNSHSVFLTFLLSYSQFFFFLFLKMLQNKTKRLLYEQHLRKTIHLKASIIKHFNIK